ncbi:hypothetical protein EBT16_05600 [bacterium]|nr:hypothetical protein [bacterium]
MPDITMCANQACPLRHDCYRFIAIPSQYQSYADFKFEVGASGAKCDSYWTIKKEVSVRNAYDFDQGAARTTSKE